MKKKEILSCGLFILLALALLLSAALVLDRKTACNYTRSVQGFFNEEADSMDVIFYGSSHMYCSLSPLEFWQESGLRSYVLATQKQPLAATYHYMEQSFEKQSPRLVVLELYMAKEKLEWADESVLRDSIDPLPWSAGKAELINSIVPREDRGSYYFNFAKYHGRWKELSGRDFDFSYLKGRDDYRGYIRFGPSRPAICQAVSYEGVEPEAIFEENLELLRRMKKLAEQNGAELVFLIAPYEGAQEDAGQFLTLHQFAREEGIGLLDLNLEYAEAGFDGETDFFDPNHLNEKGAKKLTEHFSRWLDENYDLEPESHSEDERWQQDWERLYG